MAIIPRAQENLRMNVSSPVPIAGTSDARIIGESMANMGAGAASFGKAVYSHFQRQEDFATENRKLDAKNNLENVYRESYAEAKRKAAPDGSDLGKKMMEELEPRLNELYTPMTGDTEVYKSTKMMEDRINSDFSTDLVIEQGVMLEKHNYQQLETSGDNLANSIREAPNEVVMSSKIKEYGATVDSIVAKGGMSPSNAVKVRQSFYNKSSRQFIEGLEDRKQYGKALQFLKANQEDPNLSTALSPQDAQKMGFITGPEAEALSSRGETYKVPVMTKGDKVKLTPEMSEALQHMDPKEKANWIDNLQSKALAESATRLSELNAQVNGFEVVATNGGDYSPSQVAKLKTAINNNPNLNATSRTRMMDQINTADTINSQMKVLANTPRAQWGEVMAKFDEKLKLSENDAAKYDPKMKGIGQDFAVQANRMQAKKKLMESVKRELDRQESMPASYVMKNDPAIADLFRATGSKDPADAQRYAAATLARQNYLGISQANMQLLPDPSGEADFLKAQPDSSLASRRVSELQAQWGPYFPKVMNEIASSDKSMSAYRAAVYVSPQVRPYVIDAIRNQAEINKSFKEQPGAAASLTAIKNMVSLKMESFTKGLTSGANSSKRLEIANSMQEAIKLQVMREAVRPGADLNESIDRVYKQTVADNFYFESGGNSDVVVPKKSGRVMMDEGVVSNFITANSGQEGLKRWNVQVPINYKPDRYFKDIRDNGKWVTNEAMDGISLKMRNNETGLFMPVLDNQGREIEVKYEDIQSNPQWSESKGESAMSWFGKTFVKEMHRVTGIPYAE
jgi:hypothetical protein